MFDALVLGLGKSMTTMEPGWLRRRYLIGCNNCDQWVTPEHLVVRDGPEDMEYDRRQWILGTRARTVWASQPAYWRAHGMRHGDLRQLKAFSVTAENYSTMVGLFENAKSELAWLPAGKLTPMVCISLAFAMGASRIGLLGVDLNDDHESNKVIRETEEWMASARLLMAKRGTELANLAPSSALRSLPLKPVQWLRPIADQTKSKRRSTRDATSGQDGPWATP